MSSVTAYKISIPTERIESLKKKLALTEFPEEVTDLDQSWARGPPLADMKRLVHYWGNGFDWLQVESNLNEFPQFISKTDIDGFGLQDIHFIHKRSPVSNAIPLLFIHGWPGSFIEVTRILPELVQGGEDFPAFHVVAPSLINFGFSSASKKEGFNIDQHAEAYHKLMVTLGYSEYVTQGGDLGYLISRFIALKYGGRYCKATHINNAAPAEPTATSHPELYAKLKNTVLSEEEIEGLRRTQRFSKDNGYFKQQSTKPQTIGYSLTDSPVGLLAWIYEKLHGWTDDYPWTDDEILTWVSIYYFSRAGPAATSSIYYEMEHSQPEAFAVAQAYIDIPLGVARFSRDLILLPKLWNHTLGPIVLESEYDGGHFASWERPDALVKDLRTMFGKGGGAYGCVSEKSGFE